MKRATRKAPAGPSSDAGCSSSGSRPSLLELPQGILEGVFARWGSQP